MTESDSLKKETTAVTAEDDRVVVPLLSEELAVTKQKHDTGRVRVTTVTREREELVDELLAREEAQVERVPIGKNIEAMPPVREEGDTIVIPVVEEVLVIERRLFLREEVHIRRVRKAERHQERVTLRKQEAEISRLPVDTQNAKPNSIPKD